MKKTLSIILFIICFSVSINTFAQKEPKCNIGKSIYQMKKDFPELRYIKTDTKGHQYMDGYPQDGIGVFFYIKNEIVVEECMMVQSNDGFPQMWFTSMVNAFSNYPPKFKVDKRNVKHLCYSTFSVHIIYISEHDTNTAMIIYETGGWKTGITYEEFLAKPYNQ